jgi:hypothetical protein
VFVGDEKDESDGKDKCSSEDEKKDVSAGVVNVDDMDSDDEPIRKTLASGIAKRLKNWKGKVVMSANKPSKASKKSVVVSSVGPAKRWSKIKNFGRYGNVIRARRA